MQAATLYAPQLGYATKYAPEIAFLLKDGALVQQASKYPQGSVPAKLQAQLIAAAGGGTTGINLLETLNTHQKEITSVIASAGALEKLQPYAAQLTALSKIPPSISAYLTLGARQRMGSRRTLRPAGPSGSIGGTSASAGSSSSS